MKERFVWKPKGVPYIEGITVAGVRGGKDNDEEEELPSEVKEKLVDVWLTHVGEAEEKTSQSGLSRAEERQAKEVKKDIDKRWG